MSLHADATAVLTAWRAPDEAQETLRLLYLAHLAAEPSAMTRQCHPDHLTASCLVISPDGDQVALTRHAKAGLWLQTGGHCEPGDRTLVAAALREATEESGLTDLTVDPVPLRLSRHAVPFCGPVQPAHHLDVQFMAIAHGATDLQCSPESDDVAWCPSDEPAEPTDQDVRDLIAAARRRLQEIPWPDRSADSD